MRQQLMNAFTEIYVLDLHGNAKKKERAPDGSKDENVFDIQQGVTLGILVKEPNTAGAAKVFHADLWGVRENKYKHLFESNVETTRWVRLSPDSPAYLFIPQDTALLAEYRLAWGITDAMPLNAIGLNSHRDDFAVAFDKSTLLQRIDDIVSSRVTDEDLKASYGLSDTSDFNLAGVRVAFRKEKDAHRLAVPCLYRPFDERFLMYHPEILDRPRPELNIHFVGHTNLGLAATRQTREPFGVLCMDKVCGQHKIVAAYDGSSIFPLYLYPPSQDEKQGQNHLGVELSHWPAGKDGRRPNLNAKFVADLEKRLGLKFVPEVPDVGAVCEPPRAHRDAPLQFGPEDVFHYIYAVFHSPTYRTRYAEFLKSDFPRVPITSDLKLFRSLSGLGAELVALHLLESPKLAKPIARFPVKGSNLVDKGFPKYVAPGEPEPVFVEAASRRHTGGGVNPPLQSPLPRLKAGRVYINRSAEAVAAMSSSPSSAKSPVGTPPLQGGQYFEGVPPEVWNFHIGGYQVCEKWLKDRRGRTLTYDDLEHYCKVVTALSETIRLMAAIDAAIPKWPIE